ncbi:9539_t:CDS:1 [Ambispora gerdemannii]|uniref:9539_t:CDS:1 n=1 Tax=Ambispora gerdemannii TaxID=144530 RepID=A0A9N9D6W3_9GLOM|nr:9539_t:CDS:1 [Ambispora gerdemannii]
MNSRNQSINSAGDAFSSFYAIKNQEQQQNNGVMNAVVNGKEFYKKELTGNNYKGGHEILNKEINLDSHNNRNNFIMTPSSPLSTSLTSISSFSTTKPADKDVEYFRDTRKKLLLMERNFYHRREEYKTKKEMLIMEAKALRAEGEKLANLR